MQCNTSHVTHTCDCQTPFLSWGFSIACEIIDAKGAAWRKTQKSAQQSNSCSAIHTSGKHINNARFGDLEIWGLIETFSDRFTLSCCPCQSAVCASPLRWAEIKSLYATLDHSYIVWSNTSLLHSYILTVLGQIPPFISLLIFPIKRAMVRLSKRREKKEENQPTWFCCNIRTLLLLRFRKK